VLTRRAQLTRAGSAALWRPARAAHGAPAIDATRLQSRLEQLSTFGRPAGGSFASGVSRVAYSDADVAARAWLGDEIRAAGFTPRMDAAGNVFVRTGGAPARPPILFGSHIDSVPGGGNFDGDLGTLAALEVLQAVRTGAVATRHPLEMVLWAHEESTAFGKGTACSRIVAGDLKAGDLDQEWNGLRRRDALRRIGGDPDRIEEAVRPKGAWQAYVELHIEQGGTLDAESLQIGVVEGIVGIGWWDVTIDGFANHAGTTPMDKRPDALMAAARYVQMVNRVVTSEPGRQVGTVGRIQAFPGAPNVIPGQVQATLEIRDIDQAKIVRLAKKVMEEAPKIGAENGTTFTFTETYLSTPAIMDQGVQKVIESSAKAIGLTTKYLPSGAGHDAQYMAQICPTGMIFCPSVGGISHSPKEFTKPHDVVNGANVLLQTILALDAQ
jgi:N-carbamoyl-L-amino-acid hydrolase